MAGLLRAYASSKYLPSPLSAPATKATLIIALTQSKLRYTFQNAGQLFTLFGSLKSLWRHLWRSLHSLLQTSNKQQLALL